MNNKTAVKILVSSLISYTGFISSSAAGMTSEQFSDFVRQHGSPQFFQDNNEAFKARIQMLDNAPKGSTAKILTFHFDNGVTTRKLAAHMCAAAQRGVNVEFIADSKTGDRVGKEDAFDTSAGYKMNEETYQFMANCGVRVAIHNHISEFDEILGHRIPDFPGTDLVQIDQLGSLKGLGTRHITDILPTGVKLALLADQFASVVIEAINEHLPVPEQITTDQKIKIGVAVYEQFKKLKNNEEINIFDFISQSLTLKLTPAQINQVISKVGEKFRSNDVLMEAYQKGREFNRLNHRKLFLVQDENGEGCAFIGGRNLGDHYLSWSDDSHEFVDSDILFCSHHKTEYDEDVMAQANASFDELLTDKSENLKLTEYKPNNQYVFQRLLLENRNKNPGYKFAKRIYPQPESEEAGSYIDRTIPIPRPVADSNDAITGMPINQGYNWRVRTSVWDRKKDQVRQSLYKAIDQEQLYAYIETAYSEMDDDFRAKVESALLRGVNVTLVTNSIYVSDGPSKAIRLFMSLWVRDILAKYGAEAKNTNAGIFTYKVATVHGGHMIHFKGAGFKCQKELNRSGQEVYSKSFMIGSHNFHPRSGHADKEHAILWNEPVDLGCVNKVGADKFNSEQLSWAKYQSQNKLPDLITYRQKFYKDLQARFDGQFLKEYPSFYYEITDAINSGKLDEKRAKISKLMLRLLFHKPVRGSEPKLIGGEMTEQILLLIRESGLRDILGIVL